MLLFVDLHAFVLCMHLLTQCTVTACVYIISLYIIAVDIMSSGTEYKRYIQRKKYDLEYNL